MFLSFYAWGQTTFTGTGQQQIRGIFFRGNFDCIVIEKEEKESDILA